MARLAARVSNATLLDEVACAYGVVHLEVAKASLERLILSGSYSATLKRSDLETGIANLKRAISLLKCGPLTTDSLRKAEIYMRANPPTEKWGDATHGDVLAALARSLRSVA